MGDDYGKEIGQIGADTARVLKSTDALFRSNDKRKKEINDLELNFQSIQHTVEETNQTANRVAEFMEEIKKDIGGIKKLVTHIDGRVTALEKDRFDIVMVVKWLGTTRGVIFMIVMSAMLIGSFDPGAREFILDFVGMAAKAGGK